MESISDSIHPPPMPLPAFEIGELTDQQIKFLTQYFSPGPSQHRVVHSCAVLGMSRQNHYRWLKESEAYKEVFDAIEQAQIESARSQLHNLVQTGDLNAIKFFLERRDPLYKPTSAVDVTSGGKEITKILFVPYKDEELGQTGPNQPLLGQ